MKSFISSLVAASLHLLYYFKSAECFTVPVKVSTAAKFSNTHGRVHHTTCLFDTVNDEHKSKSGPWRKIQRRTVSVFKNFHDGFSHVFYNYPRLYVRTLDMATNSIFLPFGILLCAPYLLSFEWYEQVVMVLFHIICVMGNVDSVYTRLYREPSATLLFSVLGVAHLTRQIISLNNFKLLARVGFVASTITKVLMLPGLALTHIILPYLLEHELISYQLLELDLESFLLSPLLRKIFLGPLDEEIMYRVVPTFLNRIINTRNDQKDTKLWFGRYRPMVFLWSLIFGFGHVGNHILLDKSSNVIVIEDLMRALWQSSIAFINALELYWPLYEKGGVFASLAGHMAGDHACWHICHVSAVLRMAQILE